MLFELARYHAPSTIFLDELDSIMAQRDGGGQEHEGSRRMKTELLIQMDGLARTAGDQVFVLAASNLPWDLDMAMLRRLEKRVASKERCNSRHACGRAEAIRCRFSSTSPTTTAASASSTVACRRKRRGRSTWRGWRG